jgi:cyanophycinase
MDVDVTGPLALVGSGEYLPVMTDIEARLISGRPARYVQIPMAAGREGDESLSYWTRLGREQAERLGVEAVPLVARDRDEANDPDLAAEVAGAGLVYLSGGDPYHLATNMRGTLLWDAIVTAWRGGAALAGCSAGAMALTGWVPAMRHFHRETDPGLALLPHLRVIPHFDKMLGWMPDIVTRVMVRPPAGVVALGIDEDTALVGGPEEWTVQGRQSVWVIGHGSREEFPAGSTISTPLNAPH